MLDDWTLGLYEDLFTLKKVETRPYEKSDSTWISITIEVDLSLINYERTLYTAFDLLSDVGGLSGILVTLFTVFIRAWSFNQFDNMMVSHLYKVKKKPEDFDKIDGVVQ